MRVQRRFIDYFRKAVQEMNYDSPVYKMLKKELTRLGYWRNKPRGKPDIENMKGRR
jgi:hypothetical protein